MSRIVSVKRRSGKVSYQEKRTIANIVTGVLVLAAYIITALNRYNANQAELHDMRAWGSLMLIFIGVGVVAAIITQIVLHIALSISIAVRDRGCDEKAIGKAIEAADVEDEMDKLIELKAMKIGFAVAGAGFIGALISAALGSPFAVIINILFLSFSLGSLTEGALTLYYYRAGIKA
jgi:hypothetical protein